ncbi:MAG: hypothetical protein AAGA56_07550 [Myxococcota bacterium]
MKQVPGGDFERAWASRMTMQVSKAMISVVGKSELIRLKRASGRAQDLLDAERLAALEAP